MSIVDPAVEAYAAAHTSPPDPALTALAQATETTLGQAQMLTGPVEGRLLETLVFLARPRLVVELGTFSGFSALFMAAALPPGGRLVTCEADPERAAFARARFAASPHGDRIELREGPALETLRGLEEPVDLAFVDADKAGYPAYYEALVPVLSDHGLIVADNTLRDGRVLAPAPDDEGARTMAAFNDQVLADPRTTCVLLPVRDGVTLVRRAVPS